jgi:putative nucleotidyltransferase with HDIG domain
MRALCRRSFTPMGALPTSALVRRLPQVLVATFAVVGFPILAVYLLRASGTVASPVLLVGLGTALSIAASYAGAAFWATRAGANDTVFADLMLWGWLRRWRMERRLASAVRLLELRSGSGGDPPAELSQRRRARLLEQLASALEARDPDTHGHSRRVARHAGVIAKRMGLPREEVARIRTAAAIHDVGKVEMPAEIVNKPGPLSDAEFEVIKRHVVVGARMVAGLGDEELTRIVRHHHERLDGRGYPDGLAGDRIPLGARIVAVADTFDAVTSTRPYRPARRHKEALELLAAEAGTQLDPDAVRSFRSYYSGLRPVALWALLLNGPRQLLASLGGKVRLGDLAVTTKAAAATVATLAAGSVGLHALHSDRSSHVAGASEPTMSRLSAFPAGGKAPRPSGGSSHRPSRGSSHPHGSNPQGGEGGLYRDTPGSPSASSGGGSPESQPGGGGSQGGGGSAGSGSTPGGGGKPAVTLPDTTEVTAPVDDVVESAVEKVVESVKSLPVKPPVEVPPLPKVADVQPGS